MPTESTARRLARVGGLCALACLGVAQLQTNAEGYSSTDLASGFDIPALGGANSIGVTAATIGDMNGDGYDDFVIGSPSRGDSKPSENEDIVAVVFGGEHLRSIQDLDLNQLTPDQGLIFYTSDDGVSKNTGRTVSSAGDINADGFDDLLIGATGANRFRGIVYVVFGGRFGSPENRVNLETLPAENGLTLVGDAIDRFMGLGAARAGDVNGDGFDDVIVSAPQSAGGRASSGRSYIVYGGPDFAERAANPGAEINLANMDPQQGFIVQGASNVWAGWSVAEAGDVNNDGFGDVLIGSNDSRNEAQFSGVAYVIYGGNLSLPQNTLDLEALTPAQGLTIKTSVPNARLGYTVGGVGDVNEDGFDDVLISTKLLQNAQDSFETSYLILGAENNGDERELSVDVLMPERGFSIESLGRSGDFGVPVAVGNINGDGRNDFAVGRHPGLSQLLGSEDWSENTETQIRAALDSIIVLPEVNVASASMNGDFDGDGFDDLIATDGEDAYVRFGGQTGTETPGIRRFVGTSDIDRFFGAVGHQIFFEIGHGDTVRAGAGPDWIFVRDESFAVIDGGRGTDFILLRPDVAPRSRYEFDLTPPQRIIRSIEGLKIAGRSFTTLKIDEQSVYRISDDRKDGITSLRIFGDRGDTVSFTDTGWTYIGRSYFIGYFDADPYRPYTYNTFQKGNAQVHVIARTKIVRPEGPGVTFVAN
ncbi:MAG: integrin alpha [Pseudomonadota bacterium]